MKQFVIQTFHSNLHMMEEAAAEDGDVKPLTNGIDKEEVCWLVLMSNNHTVIMIQWIFHFVKFQPKGLPYTPEQWAPNNPDGEDYMI